ncbi:MAG TPA: aminotransferase class V-fold PLP-dependent enzyme [Tepidisphaeraceae bacterium]|nr:aminotransferase class V-fold PLP-dependent enzyme [Tepidisphaeraceae bacterium]
MTDIHEYVGNAGAFPILRKWDFFNHAGVSPLPKTVSDAIRTYADQAETDTYLVGTWYKDIEALRVRSAQMLNCHRDEIAFVKNTGEGLSIVAHSVDLAPGDRIVTTNVEYPANIYPWMEQARRHGCELVMVAEEADAEGRRHVPLEKILDAIQHPRTGEQWSGIASFVSDRHDQKQIVTSLRKQHHVEIALREGRLRCSPHFYNTEAQLDRLVDRLPA